MSSGTPTSSSSSSGLLDSIGGDNDDGDMVPGGDGVADDSGQNISPRSDNINKTILNSH